MDGRGSFHTSQTVVFGRKGDTDKSISVKLEQGQARSLKFPEEFVELKVADDNAYLINEKSLFSSLYQADMYIYCGIHVNFMYDIYRIRFTGNIYETFFPIA